MVEKQSSIPIVFGIDKSYVLQVFVVIRSILLHSNSRFSFFIISIDEVEKDIRKLETILRCENDNFEISILKPSASLFEGATVTNQHISVASYNRLFIPKLLPQIEKCLYIDSDVLVFGDIAELFQIDVSDYYVAGVKDYHIISNNKEVHRRILGRNDISNYINAGVLLLNLDAIRRDKIDEKWIADMSKTNMYEDQDVINRSCYKGIKIINPKYNMFHYYVDEENDVNGILYLEKFGVQMPKEDICVVHLGGPFKPWESGIFKYTDEWWQIANVFSETKYYNELKHHMYNSRKYLYSAKKMIDICKNEKITIWGAGFNGKLLADCLLRNGIKDLLFVDRDEQKIGKEYKSIPIVDPSSNLINKDCIWLVSVKKGFGDIFKYLLEKGIQAEKICGGMNCISKEKMYYQALSNRFYEEEKKNIGIALGYSYEEVQKLLETEILLKSIGGLFANEWYGLQENSD